MKNIQAQVHIGGNNFRTQNITVYTKEEAKKILATKNNVEISDDAYSITEKNKRVAVGFEYVEDNTIMGLYVEV